MGYHDAQQVCLNGHRITDSYHESPEFRANFCDKCGMGTTHTCLSCEAEIEGYYYADGGVPLISPPVPEYCHNCGVPYPWTKQQEESEKIVATSSSRNSLVMIEQICSRFNLVARQLRSRYNGRPTLEISDEYDVQDLLHTLLRLFFDDIRPEEVTPSYAGGSSRMDFLLRDESIVIEVKKTRNGLGAKEIGSQLIDDIARYKAHPSCSTLVCFVYDPEGFIINPIGLENDLNGAEGELSVKVIIMPKA